MKGVNEEKSKRDRRLNGTPSLPRLEGAASLLLPASLLLFTIPFSTILTLSSTECHEICSHFASVILSLLNLGVIQPLDPWKLWIPNLRHCYGHVFPGYCDSICPPSSALQDSSDYSNEYLQS